jgi:IS5 family transposase
MSGQPTFASLAWSGKGKVTRRERFLTEMDAVIPWERLLARIARHYPSGKMGRPPHAPETMLRIHFLQHWFDLSDPAAEDALYDTESMRRFARLELGEDAVPDETTICRFRHFLEAHALSAALFEEVRRLLEEKGVLLQKGTIVDATIISAPSSTKNEARARDPEMRSTRKGNLWFFGMKLHIGTDLQGLVHHVTATHAAVADIEELPKLLHGQEQVVCGDKAYHKASDREVLRELGVAYRMMQRALAGQPLSAWQQAVNRSRASLRAVVEFPFRVVKRQWGFTKTRYRGIAKNLGRAHTAFALSNLYMARRTLLPA